jgi:hypothetical protein
MLPRGTTFAPAARFLLTLLKPTAIVHLNQKHLADFFENVSIEISLRA